MIHRMVVDLEERQRSIHPIMRLFRVHHPHPRAWSRSQYASNTMIRLPTAITRPLSHPRQHHLFVYFSTAKELIPDVGTPSLSCRNVRKKREKPFPVRVLHRTSANLDYNPPSPALSPLLNAETFLPYYKKHPKALPTAGNELSPREWALTVNPYGKFLFPVSHQSSGVTTNTRNSTNPRLSCPARRRPPPPPPRHASYAVYPKTPSTDEETMAASRRPRSRHSPLFARWSLLTRHIWRGSFPHSRLRSRWKSLGEAGSSSNQTSYHAERCLAG